MRAATWLQFTRMNECWLKALQQASSFFPEAYQQLTLTLIGNNIGKFYIAPHPQPNLNFYSTNQPTKANPNRM